VLKKDHLLSLAFLCFLLCYYAIMQQSTVTQRHVTTEREHPMDTPLEKPTSDNRDDWKVYWQQRRQPWRTEPEISPERQTYLDERRAISPDLQADIYPFGGIRLDRADIEWLLATHDNGKGPIDPNDEAQRDRLGLDLRGVDMSMQEDIPVNLASLPLTRTCFGLSYTEDQMVTEVGRTRASANLQSANLFSANLQSAVLRNANLQHTALGFANLQHANLTGNLQHADLSNANLQHATLGFANLQNANLSNANLQHATLNLANLQNTILFKANLQNAILFDANLQSADPGHANLQSADLSHANLQSANLGHANLHGTDLRQVQMDTRTNLNNMQVDATVFVADVTWSGTNLVNLDWSDVTHLADETLAQQRRDNTGKSKDRVTRLVDYRAAVRAYRLLTTALRDQGMNEEADRFAYRAQVCQRAVLRLQGKRGQYFWSGFLNLLAGYGYRPARTLVAYLLIIICFATSFFFLAPLSSQHFSPLAALVMSVASFHGRGFFPAPSLPLDAPLTVVAAGEAILGLVIEASFIATFTQRYFNK
jgi:uncharacterized protein YjbI with pentapeptide repeats